VVASAAGDAGPGSCRLGLTVGQGQKALIVEEEVASLAILASDLIIKIVAVGDVLETLAGRTQEEAALASCAQAIAVIGSAVDVSLLANSIEQTIS
jgi:hypothetical protein